MMLTPIEELIIAAHMRALTQMFEGAEPKKNRIIYQAMVGFDDAEAGERARFIDAADSDGVFAIFDPRSIEKGPAYVGVCMRDRDMVRLNLGSLWVGRDDRAVLVTRNGCYLKVEGGRFVQRPGKPTPDLTRGRTRARRRLAKLVSVRADPGVTVVTIG